VRIIATVLGGFAIGAIAVGCGGGNDSGTDTEAAAITLPTVTAPAPLSEKTTPAKKPETGRSDKRNQGQPSSERESV
jgi:hypothetical protein